MAFRTPKNWLIYLELLILTLWVLWIGAPYLNFDPIVYPAGRELKSTIASHHLWPNLLECGTCAFWNADQRGGFPAFADVASSALNPIVGIPTLLLGVVNGSKAALLLVFWVAGFAQWWIARLLNARAIVRVWVGMLAVTGGHLASRMELGALNVVIATTMGSLVIAAIIWLYKSPGSRPIAILGLTLAGIILAGSGYMQVGVIALLPAIAFLVFDSNFKLKREWLNFLKAAALALLLAATLLIPFMHFSGNFNKEVDPQFKSAQPLEFIPLNLVIDDVGFYRSEALGKAAFPHLYALYIGWAPVLLALIGIAALENKDKNIARFMLAGIIFILLTASATPLEFLVEYFPGLAGIRHVPQIAGLAVPLILGLAAVGLEQVLSWPWPKLSFGLNEWSIRIPASLIVIAILIPNLQSTKQFAQEWIGTDKLTAGVREVISSLKTDNLQWVNPPFGEHFFIEPAIAAGLKLSPGVMTYRWEGREPPTPVLQASRQGPPMEGSEQVDVADGVPVYENPAPPYAAVYLTNGDYVECAAQGEGGFIAVACENEQNGTLRVLENNFSGWQAELDGQNLPLLDSRWLEVQALSGEHNYIFRYQPWDVPLGLGFTALGLVASVWLLVPEENREKVSNWVRHRFSRSRKQRRVGAKHKG